MTASAVEMSGFGAPVRTATPTDTVASGVSLAATTWPDAITGSNGSCTTGTSNGSPLMTRSLVPPPEPNVALTLCPVARSKSGIICSTAALMPPGAMRVTSAARPRSELHTVMMATADNSKRFMAFLPYRPVI